MQCPEHSFYSTCVSKCADSCQSFVNAYPNINGTNNDPGAPHFCIDDGDCNTGCQCDDGYLADYINGKLRCVKSDECGCRDSNGNYHNNNESWYGNDCHVIYTCTSTNHTESNNTSCTDGETCQQDGNGNFNCASKKTTTAPLTTKKSSSTQAPSTELPNSSSSTQPSETTRSSSTALPNNGTTSNDNNKSTTSVPANGESTKPFTLSTLHPGSHSSTTKGPIYDCIQKCYIHYG
ncbi:hypothetical protein FO519_010376, partial [Halicephalobus sp. NKZ332]